ncbi:MAG: DUF11 domain-containing protein, partial [bacterium]|nr:DUF11 domain-containing protein [bacterium]
MRTTHSIFLVSLLAISASGTDAQDSTTRSEPFRAAAPVATAVEAYGTCVEAEPVNLGVNGEYSDESSTCESDNNMRLYGSPCRITEPYPGKDRVYVITLAPENNVSFLLENTAGSQADLVLALVGECGNGMSCRVNSPDFIGPHVEHILRADYNPDTTKRTYYLYIDSALEDGMAGSCGGYRLTVDGPGILPQSDLKVGIHQPGNEDDPPGRVVAGSGEGNLTYEVKVTNKLKFTATKVEVRYQPPEVTGVRVESITASAGSFKGSKWTVGDLAPNTSASLEVVLTVEPSAPDNKKIRHHAEVQGTAETLVNTSDDKVTKTTKIVRRTDLSVTKSDSPDPAVAGRDLVTYTLAVLNAGPSDASAVQLIDELPDGVDFISASADCTHDAEVRTVRCDLGVMPARTSAMRTITAAVRPSTIGRIPNRVSVGGNEKDPNL